MILSLGKQAKGILEMRMIKIFRYNRKSLGIFWKKGKVLSFLRFLKMRSVRGI